MSIRRDIDTRRDFVQADTRQDFVQTDERPGGKAGVDCPAQLCTQASILSPFSPFPKP